MKKRSPRPGTFLKKAAKDPYKNRIRVQLKFRKNRKRTHKSLRTASYCKYFNGHFSRIRRLNARYQHWTRSRHRQL